MSVRRYYVYMVASRSHVLYIGVTGDLARRASEHKQRLVPGFTEKYRVTQLVWYEVFDTPQAAIAREKQLKRWRREKKVALIESANPAWDDLAADGAR